MSEIGDRIKGAADETIGKAKRALGDALGKPDLRAEGDAQEAKGDLESAAGKAKGAVKDVVDKV